jgi:hypothetical protein
MKKERFVIEGNEYLVDLPTSPMEWVEHIGPEVTTRMVEQSYLRLLKTNVRSAVKRGESKEEIQRSIDMYIPKSSERI